MRIRCLSIRNFRGIRHLDWSLPDQGIICLIGRGDSRKSTILEALRRAFHPQWNLAFDDADFYQCAPENEIDIRVVLGDIPDAFHDLANYGNALCGWDSTLAQQHEDPGESLEAALWIRLRVGRDLEPSWTVIKRDGDEGVLFKASDRAKVAVTLIGAASDRHLTWTRGSLLSRLTDGDTLSASMADAGRAAKAALDSHRGETLKKFDAVASAAETTARSLGVLVNAKYKAHLDSDGINIRVGGLALHDGDVPLRQLGLGSKRLLTTGLQQHGLKEPHITLLDEVESGLEPHRIARLLKHLSQDATGQYVLTTHSPVVLRELSVKELHIVHCRDDAIQVIAANNPAIADFIQGKIRSSAEAFLAPRIVVCEGATEVGFLRGMDNFWISRGKESLAYQGVAMIDAHGASRIKHLARGVRLLHYGVAVLADADCLDQFSHDDANDLRSLEVHVSMWEDALSIEGRVFADIPWPGAIAMYQLACSTESTPNLCLDQVQSAYGSSFPRVIADWKDQPLLRSSLAKAAKAGEWFKRQDKAHAWVDIMAEYWDEMASDKRDLVVKLNDMREWIDLA